jgi:putative phage-type endonuclease
MNRDEWLKQRMSGVGGSDAPAVLGLSKWRTPLDVYLEKRGEGVPTEDREPMRWGRILEQPIRQEYAERTGRIVRVPDGLIRHPQHDWMLATVDGVTDDGRLVEIKTARSADGWGEPGTDEVPQAYLIQVQHYLTVTALSVADVAVLIGGQDYRQYEIQADPELQAMIVESEAEFWDRVQNGTPPDPVNYSDVVTKYGRASRSATIVADAATVAAVETLRAIREQYKAIEESEQHARAIVMQALGEADTLADVDGRVLCTWRAAKAAQRLDAAALKVAHPDIYTAFLKAGDPSRRFLIKE